MRLAIVVGHTPTRPGAPHGGGIYDLPLHRENAWASALAAQCAAVRVDGETQVRVFRQTSDAYPAGIEAVAEAVNAWRADLVIAVHANAGSGAPRRKPGAMYQPGDAVGKALAEDVARGLGQLVAWDCWTRGQVRSWSKAEEVRPGVWEPRGPEFRVMTKTHAPAIILETHRIDQRDEHEAMLRALDVGVLGAEVVEAAERVWLRRGLS